MALQATNAGINFQSRIGAWLLLNMLFDSELPQVKLGNDRMISQVWFEGVDAIDDIIVTFENQERHFYQAKRTISFSTLSTSEFYKVCKQFVQQFIEGEKKDKYILVSSSKASNKVIDNLRRIIESIQQSDIKSTMKIFNKADDKLWEEFSCIVEAIYKEKTGTTLSLKKLDRFIKHIHIIVYDIEDNETFESSVFLFIKSKTSANAKELWSSLITLTLTLATNRSGCSRNEIEKNYAIFLSTESIIKTEFSEVIDELDHKSIWKDYLLITSDEIDGMKDNENKNLYITSIYRFTDSGKKEITYKYDGTVVLPNKIQGKVLYRCSAYNRIDDYLKENSQLTEEYDGIVFMLAKDGEDVNEFERLRVNWVKEQLQLEIEQKRCIICGNPFNDEHGTLVEVDNAVDSDEVGIAHIDCRRPFDRVFGSVTTKGGLKSSCLRNIDVELWIRLLEGGQAFVNGLNMMRNNIFNAFWNPQNNQNKFGLYCVVNLLENGDKIYTKVRGKVDRMEKISAEYLAHEFAKQHKAALDNNNPNCYTEKTLMYGIYTYLSKTIGVSESIIACVDAKVERYNKNLSKMYDKCERFYTPLLVFETGGEIFSFNGIVPFVSDITQVDDYIENWSILNENVIGDIKARIVEDDTEFDQLISRYIEKYDVVVNPRLGRNNELISGAILYTEEMLN